MSDAQINFIPNDRKIDRLGQESVSAVGQRLALGVGIAVGGDHDDGNVRPRRLRLGQKIKPAHPWHIDVGEDQDELSSHSLMR